MVRHFGAGAGLASAAVCSAQSINIDYGAGMGIPSPAYGAAAGQPGYWNEDGGNTGAGVPLYDIHGLPTPVIITPSLPAGSGVFNNAATMGDDEALMDDYLSLHSTPVTFEITGLASGAYTFYVYAWAPDSPDFITFVQINNTGIGSIGGPWPGGHQINVTYARHNANVGPGETVTVWMRGVPAGSLNGTQIVGPGSFCYANCDGSTAAPALNVNDFVCFQSRFASGDTLANCDGSTQEPVLNVNDFICFQGRFAAGCL